MWAEGWGAAHALAYPGVCESELVWRTAEREARRHLRSQPDGERGDTHWPEVRPTPLLVFPPLFFLWKVGVMNRVADVGPGEKTKT